MHSLPAVTAFALLDGLRSLGHDADAYAKAAGLPLINQMEPFSTVPSNVFERIWMVAFENDDRPHLPVLAGASVPFGAFGLLDYLVGSAPNLGQGLIALDRYFRLVAITVRLEVDSKSGWIRIKNRPSSHTDYISDAFTVAVITKRFGSRVPSCIPREINLTHPVGPAVEPFEKVLGCRVSIGRTISGIRYAPETLNQPLAGAEPVLHKTLKNLADRSDVQSYFSGPVSYAVCLRLSELLEIGKARSDQVASSLNMSVRTLQRRLNDEGTSYESVLDGFRRDEGTRLLKDQERPIYEVARRLGYEEPSSFTRAFRRWYGKTPSEWRKQLHPSE